MKAAERRVAPPPESRGGPGRVQVIWNPNAGSKAGIPTNRTSEDQLRETLARHGLGDRIVATASEEEAVAAVRSALADGCDVVAGAGGDGTIGTIAFELLGSQTALGILPLGSAMNVARSLEIPRELDAAAAVLASGNIRLIDVGLANGRPFLEAGSVGINASVFAAAQRIDDGDFSSVLDMLAEAIAFRPARMRIDLDEESISTRALMVTVANAPYTGLGLALAPGARVDDGLFDVRVFSGVSKLELLRYTIRMLLGGSARSRKIQTWRSRRVRVTARQPRPLRADSHDLGTTPVLFEVRPQALRVVAPEPVPAGSSSA